MNIYMKKADENALNVILNKEGGPFGAVIVDKQNNIIANGNNKVLLNNDPTAHAEIVAIREACKKLGTYNLSGCTLYTSCEPCPMCLSAIIWSGIKDVYYACTRTDAENVGFRDNVIYEYLSGEHPDFINLVQIDREDCLDTMEKYKKDNGIIY